MEYHSAIKRNKIGSFVETWMDLETVIQSEVSQKEKNKYCIFTHIEKWYLFAMMNLFAKQIFIEYYLYVPGCANDSAMNKIAKSLPSSSLHSG